MTQQLLPFSPSRIGSQVVVWKVELSNEAYTDQFGRKHTGHIVHEEILVTIVDQRTVEGEWGISEFTQGYRAGAEDGRVFTHDWEKGSDGVYWRAETYEKGIRYVDVCQLYSRHRIFATPEGQPARPVNALVCEEHGSAFMPGSEGTSKGCHECYMDLKYPTK
jgi:hypothetical protein